MKMKQNKILLLYSGIFINYPLFQVGFLVKPFEMQTSLVQELYQYRFPYIFQIILLILLLREIANVLGKVPKDHDKYRSLLMFFMIYLFIEIGVITALSITLPRFGFFIGFILFIINY